MYIRSFYHSYQFNNGRIVTSLTKIPTKIKTRLPFFDCLRMHYVEKNVDTILIINWTSTHTHKQTLLLPHSTKSEVYLIEGWPPKVYVFAQLLPKTIFGFWYIEIQLNKQLSLNISKSAKLRTELFVFINRTNMFFFFFRNMFNAYVNKCINHLIYK